MLFDVKPILYTPGKQLDFQFTPVSYTHLAKPETVPAPSPFRNILPKVLRKLNLTLRKL